MILVDKSAYVRSWAQHVTEDDACFCSVTRMEILYSARNAGDYDARAEELAAFRDLRMDATTFTAAEAAQRELARTGEHRVPLPDLLIAACAQQHGADVLSGAKHFDLLAPRFGFRSLRV